MSNLKYICVQPRLLYYAWQLEVMINNFLKHGVNPDDMHILVAYSQDKNDKTNNLELVELYNKLTDAFPSVNFFYYEDDRVNPSYIPSVRPNILKKHFAKFPELEQSVIFYHDCDIVLTKSPNFNELLNDDVWYMSDTNSYLNYDYIVSKGEDIYKKMCEIVGIDESIPKENRSNAGGAQYIMKNVNSNFWEKVELDCEELYKFFLKDEPKKLKLNPSYHPIQSWTSDMWAVLWNAWKLGNKTKLHPYLDFTWAPDPISRWDDNLIFHNAGVVSDGNLFYKGKYLNTLPYNIEDTFSKSNASYNYYKEIVETAQKSCLRN